MIVMQLLQLETHKYNNIPKNSLLRFFPLCLSLCLTHFLSIFSHIVSQSFSFSITHSISLLPLPHPLTHTGSLWRSVRVPSALLSVQDSA